MKTETLQPFVTIENQQAKNRFYMRLTGKYVGVVFLLLGLFWSCKNQEQPNPLLIGNWRWKGSSGGIGGASIKPGPTERIMLRFSANQQFSLHQNDTLLHTGAFHLTKARSIYSGKDELRIETEQVRTGYQQKTRHIIVIEGIVSTVSATQLSIGDNAYDGYGSSYVRVK